MTVAAHELGHRGSATIHTSSNMALEDRFEVLKEIGDGSFGSVVLARVRSAGASVARRGTVVCFSTFRLISFALLISDIDCHQDNEEDF